MFLFGILLNWILMNKVWDVIVLIGIEFGILFILGIDFGLLL